MAGYYDCWGLRDCVKDNNRIECFEENEGFFFPIHSPSIAYLRQTR